MIRPIEKTIKKVEKLKGERGSWDAHIQEITDYMVPRKNDIVSSKYPGQKRNAQILDNTGMQAAELLTGTLHGLLLNPAALFFEFTTGDDALDQLDAVRAWFEDSALRMHNRMNNSNFQTEAHEFLLDLVTINTANMLILEDQEFVFTFKSHFMKELYLCENEKGFVDEIYRVFNWKADKIIAEFGKAKVPRSVIEAFEANTDKEFEIIHCMHPVDQYGEKRKNFRFKIVSQYILVKDKHELRLGGFNEWPWPVARWAKASGEVTGRGPGMNALPEVKMANLMEEVMIRGAQKTIDPPLQVPDDGFVLPIKTRAGGVNVRRNGAGRTDGKIEPIFNNANIEFGIEMMRDRRARIREAFYIDQLQTPQLDRQTATEVTKRADEQLRFLGPLVGRLDVEFLRPVVERCFAIMERRNMFLPPPPELKDQNITVRFSSKIAKLQRMSEADNMFQTLKLITPFVPMDPSIVDNFDGDAITRGIAQRLSFPQKFLRDVKKRDAMRQAKAEAEQKMRDQQSAMNEAEIANKAAPAAATVMEAQQNKVLEEL